RVKLNHKTTHLSLEVIPLKNSLTTEREFLVIFESATPVPAYKAAGAETVLLEKLKSTRLHLESLVHEKAMANEELQTANEELRSSNEELRILNEELVSAEAQLRRSKEALEHSNNEALKINNDLTNLLSSIQIPIVMLDHHLCIQRFTPMAT